LVQFMLEEPAYLEQIHSSGIVEYFAHKETRMAAQKIIERYCENPGDFDKLGASLTSQGLLSELLTSHIGLRAKNDLDKAGEKQLIQDCLRRVKDRHLKVLSKSLLSSLKTDSQSTPEDLETFMKIAMEQKGPKTP
jgi:hypothetical protein